MIIALQSGFNADFASHANGNVALLLRMYVSAVVMRTVRSVGAEWAIWRSSARGGARLPARPGAPAGAIAAVSPT